MSVQRHRTNHILAPARVVAEAAAKGADAAAQRAQVMASAQAGDPQAFIALAAIVEDLRKAQDRLERSADKAEEAGQGTTVAALSGQQLRAAEVRAKLGGIGGYAPGRGVEGSVTALAVNVFIDGQRRETIVGARVEPVQDVEEAELIEG